MYFPFLKWILMCNVIKMKHLGYSSVLTFSLTLPSRWLPNRSEQDLTYEYTSAGKVAWRLAKIISWNVMIKYSILFSIGPLAASTPLSSGWIPLRKKFPSFFWKTRQQQILPYRHCDSRFQSIDFPCWGIADHLFKRKRRRIK